MNYTDIRLMQGTKCNKRKHAEIQGIKGITPVHTADTHGEYILIPLAWLLAIKLQCSYYIMPFVSKTNTKFAVFLSLELNAICSLYANYV